VHADGTKTNKIAWYKTQCTCGQYIKYRQYFFEDQEKN